MTTTQILTIAADEGCHLAPDYLTEAIHQSVPGSHTLESVDLTDADLTHFEWDEDQPQLPLTRREAEQLLTEQLERTGDNSATHLSIITTISQSDYLEGYARFAAGHDEDHHDLLHDLCFDFGMAADCTDRILTVSADQFVVRYTTNIVETMTYDDD